MTERESLLRSYTDDFCSKLNNLYWLISDNLIDCGIIIVWHHLSFRERKDTLWKRTNWVIS